MERILHIDPNDPNRPAGPGPVVGVALKQSHLLIEAALAARVLGDTTQVYTTYKEDIQELWVAPMADTAFKAAHTCSLNMLKTKNLHGDKSITLQEFFLDHDLDTTDRSLSFEPGEGVLKVKMA